MITKHPYISAVLIFIFAVGVAYVVGQSKIAFKAAKTPFGVQCVESGGEIQVDPSTNKAICVNMTRVSFPSVTPSGPTPNNKVSR